jgi:hypothetical protein
MTNKAQGLTKDLVLDFATEGGQFASAIMHGSQQALVGFMSSKENSIVPI